MTVYAEPVFTDDGKIIEWAGLFVRHADASNAAPNPREIKRAHIRAARALLDWSIEDLSAASGVSISSIRRIEGGEVSSARGQTIKSVTAALEKGGVVFHGLGDKICIALCD